MSRVGKKPIPLPKGVKVAIGEELEVQGPKGKLKVPVPPGIHVRQAEGNLEVIRDGDQYAALHGLTRALAANAVQGVSAGFVRELDIVGIGYRADIKGRVATFTLGYSHPIEFPIPKGIQITVEKATHVTVTGFDRQQVGQVAAQIRGFKECEPYKGKGVMYTGEVIQRKAGKAAK